MLPDEFGSKSLFFCHYLSVFKKKSLQETPIQIIFSIQTTYYKFILEHITAFPSYHSFNICLMCHSFALRNWKQSIFSTPRLNSWNGKFPIGSLYEFTSSQKFSMLVSQASCLIMVQSNFSSPWYEISYGKDCGHRHSLQCSLHKQWQL